MGLKSGQKWCLCASRWREALEHAKTQSPSEESVVPKVHLHATHEKALEVVSMHELKEHAAEGEAANASTIPQSAKGRNNYPGSVGTKTRTELAGKGEMSSRDEL